MNTAQARHLEFAPPPPHGTGRSLTASLIVHGLLLVALTAGINWYPDNGVAFQFNATHVMSLKSPLNWNPQSTYEGGSHPTFLEGRVKVYF